MTATGDDGGSPSRVAVVGGGAVGVTAAHDLAAGGADVTLYERDDLAGGASGRAAGICYDAFAGRRDAQVARRAMSRFRALAEEGDIPFEPCPYVWLAREGDERRATAVQESAAAMADRGLDVGLLDRDELGERFPRLRVDDVAVAAVAEDAAHTDTTAYVEAMCERAREAGLVVRTHVAGRLRVEDGTPQVDAERTRTYDAVLVAAGARTPGLLADAGIEIPVKPYRVQALVGNEGYDAPICYDATGGFYVRPHPEGLLAGDGTEETAADPDRYDRTGDDWFVEDVREGVAHRLKVDTDIDRAWAGLCTATPDRDPLVGDVREGVYVATGFQGHGFMRAPAIGEVVAEEMLGGEGIPGFDPTRFDGDEAFEIRQGMAVDGTGRFSENG
jgi:glycine/D-amino acid oxidase-like deaminating enzyme